MIQQGVISPELHREKIPDNVVVVDFAGLPCITGVVPLRHAGGASKAIYDYFGIKSTMIDAAAGKRIKVGDAWLARRQPIFLS